MVTLAVTQEAMDDGTIDEIAKVDCNPACPFIYRPVCGGLSGEHEESFTNECMLKLRNCVMRTSKFDCLRRKYFLYFFDIFYVADWVVLRTGNCN